MITSDTILNQLKSWVERNEIHSPHEWVDEALKLTVLLGDEANILYCMEQLVAQEKVEFIKGGDTVAKAKSKIEATDKYRQSRIQKSKITQIEELIRIAKLRSRLASDDMKGY